MAKVNKWENIFPLILFLLCLLYYFRSTYILTHGGRNYACQVMSVVACKSNWCTYTRCIINNKTYSGRVTFGEVDDLAVGNYYRFEINPAYPDGPWQIMEEKKLPDSIVKELDSFDWEIKPVIIERKD